MNKAFGLAVLCAACAFAVACHYANLGWWIQRPEAALYITALTMGAIALVWMPGLALAAAMRRDDAASSLAYICIGSAAGGWIVFWIWFVSPAAGVAAAAVVMLGSAIVLIRNIENVDGAVLRGAILAALICVLYVCIAGDKGGLDDGAMTMTNRYWTNMDNSLPRIFADKFLADPETLKPFLLGDWKSSDRPPLQTSMVLTGYALAAPGSKGLAYFLLSVAANALWMIALQAFLLSLGVDERKLTYVLVAVALTGAVYFNTVYTWPKILAGALAMCAVVLLRSLKRPVLGGTGVALALGAHGSVVFGFVGLLPVAFGAIRRVGLRYILICAATMVALYAPWVAYQKFFDPPGTRLIKWHLANKSTGGQDDQPALEAIVSAYKEAGLVEVIKNKVTNIQTILGDPWITNPWRIQPAWTYPLGVFRVETTQKYGAVPGVLLIGVLAFLFMPSLRGDRALRAIATVVLVSSVAYGLIEFGGTTSVTAVTWQFNGPSTLLLLWCTLGALAAYHMPGRWPELILGAHAVFFYIIWIYTVSFQSAMGSVDAPRQLGVVAVGWLIGIVLAIVLWGPERFRGDQTEPLR